MNYLDIYAFIPKDKTIISSCVANGLWNIVVQMVYGNVADTDS